MAVYHLQIKPLGRGSGRSAVAAAAYRAGERLLDLRTGLAHDYTRRAGVVAAHMVLPSGAAWRPSRNALWNAAEAAERRKDGRTAREFELALPFELGSKARARLALGFARELADRYRIAVDVALHTPGRGGDERNWHAHLLATTRRVVAEGLGEKAPLELADGERRKRGLPSGADEITALRERWAAMVNKALEEAGSEARIDHRTLAAQGIERAPQSKFGAATLAMERRGRRTERGDEIRESAETEAQRSALRELIARGEIELSRIRMDPTERFADAVARLSKIEHERKHIEQQLRLARGEELPAVPELAAVAAKWALAARADAAHAVASESAWRRWWWRLWSAETRTAVERARLLRQIALGHRPASDELLAELRSAQRRLQAAERKQDRRTCELQQALGELIEQRRGVMTEFDEASQALPPSARGMIQRGARADAGVTVVAERPEMISGSPGDPRM